MPVAARILPAIFVLLTVGALPVGAQTAWLFDPPTVLEPLRPPTKKELQQRDALKLYGLGLLCQREDRLLEALTTFEKAARLDPEAAPVYRAMIPLYLALDRQEEALTASRKALDLDPGHYETWFLLARQLRLQGKLKESRDALERASKCPRLQEHPDHLQQIYFDLGAGYESDQQYEKAATAFAVAVQVLENPDLLMEFGPYSREEIVQRAAETHERIGRLYLQARKFDRAIAAFRSAQKKYPQGAGHLNYNLAQVCRQQGKLSEALKYLDNYLQLQPQSTEPYELRITLLRDLKKKDDIVPSLEEYVQKDHHNLSLKLLLAREYANAGQSAKAEKLYRDVAAISPKTEVYRSLLRLYLADQPLGLNKALTLFNKMVSDAVSTISPPSGTVPLMEQAQAVLNVLRDDETLAKGMVKVALGTPGCVKGLHPRTCFFLAVLADKNQMLAEAEQLYRVCLEHVRPEQQPSVYGGLLQVLAEERKYKEIVELCRQGLRSSPAINSVLFHTEMARALVQLGKKKEAVQEVNQAVTIAAEPERRTLRRFRALVLAEVEEYDKAVAECLALLKDEPAAEEVRSIRYLMSNIYSTARDYPKAEEQLQLILKTSPADASASNDLGYLWADQGKNLKEAEALIRKALELDRQQKSGPFPQAGAVKDHAAYVDSLGWVLFRQGHLEAARKELERATQLPEGEDPVIWDHLADVYVELEMMAPARRAWQKAVDLYEKEKRRRPDERYKEIKHKLKLLESRAQP
jgi:tetratricopeptide (TPR) repeat protein